MIGKLTSLRALFEERPVEYGPLCNRCYYRWYEKKKRTRITRMRKQEKIVAENCEERKHDAQIKEEIQCICGDSKEDDFMILCDKCKSWLHCACVGIQRGNVPQGRYTCPRCILQTLNRASSEESKQGTEVESHRSNKRCASEVFFFFYLFTYIKDF